MKTLFNLSALTLAVTISTQTTAAEFSFTNKIDDNANALVLFYAQDGSNKQFKSLNKTLNNQLQRAIDSNDFSGKYASVVEVLATHSSDFNRVLIVGTGEQEKLDKALMSKLGGNIHAQLLANKTATATIASDELAGVNSNSVLAANFAHGANLRDHRFEKYKQTNSEYPHNQL